MTSTCYLAGTALLPDGWARDVLIDVTERGDIAAVRPGSPPDAGERLDGPVLPGVPNLHSHAFQRAMAGLAEHAGGRAAEGDDFWTWRDTMYRFLDRLGPEEIEAIAAQVYVEMVRQGYTAVGEFHYVHHPPGGGAYEDPAELSHRVVAAARQAGIGITHLPVLYAAGGFGGLPPAAGQRRFLNKFDALLELVESVHARYAGDPQIRVGIAPHSLRAVPPEMLAAVVDAVEQGTLTAPVHIHVAEQMKEVEACLAWSGARPVEWLLDHAPVDEHWCLIHATHMTGAEVERLAATGAVAGLCPTTEANLGDGIFSLNAYLAAGGRFGIGSDSNVSVSPIEELRWLEYGQRLHHRARIMAAEPETGSVSRTLYERALDGGARALGRPIGRIAAGQRADLVILDPDHPSLIGRSGDRLLDSMVFVGNSTPVRHVMVGGRWVVRDGRHAEQDEVLDRYRRAMLRLAG